MRESIGRMEYKQFELQWIPSHVGIYGNEMADDLAQRACHLEEISKIKITDHIL